MAISLVACAPANNTPTEGNKTVEYVDPFKDIADYDELSAAAHINEFVEQIKKFNNSRHWWERKINISLDEIE